MKPRLYSSVFFLTLALGAAAQNLPVTNQTAFALVREADKRISSQARDQVVEIHSEKSVGGLMPNIWYLDFYDSTASLKTTEVKFVAGQISKITRPHRWRAWFSGTRPLEWPSVKIDSDRALAIALKEAGLKNLNLQAAQFWLQRTTIGSTWKIRFWAAWPAGITDIYISSKNGEVLKNTAHRQNRG